MFRLVNSLNMTGRLVKIRREEEGRLAALLPLSLSQKIFSVMSSVVETSADNRYKY
jgi:hypothetical protein